MTKAIAKKKVTKKATTEKSVDTNISAVVPIENADLTSSTNKAKSSSASKVVLLLILIGLFIAVVASKTNKQPYKTAITELPNKSNHQLVLAATDTAPSNDQPTPPTTSNSGTVQPSATVTPATISTVNNPVATTPQAIQPATTTPTTSPTSSNNNTDNSTSVPVPTPDPITIPPIAEPDPIPSPQPPSKPHKLLNVVGNLIQDTLQHIF